MLRALKYFFVEAAASLWRGRRAAMLAVLTIAGGLFVLGFFLALNTNLQRLVGRWSESAELSVYFKDDVSQDQLRMVDELVAQSGLAAHREYVSKQQAADAVPAGLSRSRRRRPNGSTPIRSRPRSRCG